MSNQTAKKSEEEIVLIYTGALGKLVESFDDEGKQKKYLRHRASGKLVEFVCIALGEDDLLPEVIYRENDTSVCWRRPVLEFIERFELPPDTIVPQSGVMLS